MNYRKTATCLLNYDKPATLFDSPFLRLCAILCRVAHRACTVSFQAATGVRHAVEVEAESIYEAAAIGLARLKADGWVEGLGPGTRLEIAVRAPATSHNLTVAQLQRWLNGVTPSPADVVRKTKLKKLLAEKS
jgi:hypothetical protein